MSSPTKVIKPVPRADNASPSNGEQDQGVPFKGPTPSNEDDSAIAKTPDLDSGEFAKPPVSGLRRDSLKNIGQRRRSSASNQPSVNLRKAQGYGKDNEMARNVGA